MRFVLWKSTRENDLSGKWWVAACCIAAGCAPAAEPLVIGAAGPWKEGYGRMNRLGIELALEDINRAGGVAGRPIMVRMQDDEGSGAKAAAIAQQFVADRTVIAVVGHVNSGAMTAAARVYDGSLPAVATTATSPDLTGVSPWVFRVISSDSANGLEIARFATARGRRRAAIMYENNSYGRGLTDAFRRGFAGTIVSVDAIAEGEQDFEPFIAFYKRQAADLVFVAGTEASGMAILREARRQSLAADFMGGDGWTGIVADTAASEGAYVGAPFAASDPRPEAQRFVAAFVARHGRVPDGNAALAYDATMLIAQAIERAGADREAVRDWLASIDAKAALPGVTGPLRFHPSGDPVGKGIVMTRVRRGELVVERGR
jgi:branched-chain amino acid transport system substrate-binding protein